MCPFIHSFVDIPKYMYITQTLSCVECVSTLGKATVTIMNSKCTLSKTKPTILQGVYLKLHFV